MIEEIRQSRCSSEFSSCLVVRNGQGPVVPAWGKTALHSDWKGVQLCLTVGNCCCILDSFHFLHRARTLPGQSRSSKLFISRGYCTSFLGAGWRSEGRH